jgi:hypothetical protein
MSHQSWQARNKRELIVEVWEYLDCDSVGAHELAQIQDEMLRTFGAGAVDSPAAIARALVDEGAILRHPEVIAFDVHWRQSQMPPTAADEDLDLLNLAAAAEALIQQAQLWPAASESERERVREVVAMWGREAELLSASLVINEQQRRIAQEIRGWIGVWLQSSELFEDWLNLRQQTPEFLSMFEELPKVAGDEPDKTS